MIDIVEVNNEQARLAAEMRAAVTDRASPCATSRCCAIPRP